MLSFNDSLPLILNQMYTANLFDGYGCGAVYAMAPEEKELAGRMT